MPGIKLNEMAKNLDIPNKDITILLSKYINKRKSSVSNLTEQELSIVLEYYTQNNQIDVFDFLDPKTNFSGKNNNPENVDLEQLENIKEIDLTIQNHIDEPIKYVDTRFVDVDTDKLDTTKVEELVSESLDNFEPAKKQKVRKNKNIQPKKQEHHATANKNSRKTKQVTNIKIPDSITVMELASKIKQPLVEVVKKLVVLGIMAAASQVIDYDTASIVCSEFGVKTEKEIILTQEEMLFNDFEDKDEELEVRPPVVVVMGHVDHGKTSLLDYIRKTNVISSESGGITQHIGAYQVNVHGKLVSFLDTPGHEAFTSMRARGAKVTDIAILVVAADDGIMPQTIEAINHAKAAQLSIIVAINKIDKEGADEQRIKQDLMEHGLVPEEWGGDTICVPVSAKTGQNIDQLLEMILLVADMKELTANPNRNAKGVVIESKLDKARGPVATVLVQNGTLKLGDILVVGTTMGKIRAMNNDNQQKARLALPSSPVEILGLSETPESGDMFYVVTNERSAKELIEKRKHDYKLERGKASKVITLENLFDQIKEGQVKELGIIIKADVQGSLEAMRQSLEKLSIDEVKVRIVHGGVGTVTESDIMLAMASGAIIIGFNVRPPSKIIESAKQQKVEIKLYNVIYNAINDITDAVHGMLEPEYEEIIDGNAEVRHVFKITGAGVIAGSYVKSGTIERNSPARLIRDGIQIYDGKIASLRIQKDDKKEVNAGYECGISLDKYQDIKVGDIVECYSMKEIAKTRK